MVGRAVLEKMVWYYRVLKAEEMAGEGDKVS